MDGGRGQTARRWPETPTACSTADFPPSTRPCFPPIQPGVASNRQPNPLPDFYPHFPRRTPVRPLKSISSPIELQLSRRHPIAFFTISATSSKNSGAGERPSLGRTFCKSERRTGDEQKVRPPHVFSSRKRSSKLLTNESTSYLPLSPSSHLHHLLSTSRQHLVTNQL